MVSCKSRICSSMGGQDKVTYRGRLKVIICEGDAGMLTLQKHLLPSLFSL